MSKDGFKIEGFSRVQITEDGKVKGDSGWVGPNQITIAGFSNYIINLLGATTNSKQVKYIALGTGTKPNVTHTSLNGELTGPGLRIAISDTDVAEFSNVGSYTAKFLGSFLSSDSFITATVALKNVGLFNASAITGAGDTLFAGNSYDSSTCDTNQNVNVTYQINFTTS